MPRAFGSMAPLPWSVPLGSPIRREVSACVFCSGYAWVTLWRHAIRKLFVSSLPVRARRHLHGADADTDLRVGSEGAASASTNTTYVHSETLQMKTLYTSRLLTLSVLTVLISAACTSTRTQKSAGEGI